MPRIFRRKIKSGRSFFAFVLIFCLLFFVANSSFLPQVSAATFIESFSSIGFADLVNTTADWEINSATAHLLNGDWVKANDTKIGSTYDSLTQQGVYNDVTSFKDGNPLVIFSYGSGISALKWTPNAPAGVCPSGNSCWTNLAGNEITPDYLGFSSASRVDVLKLPSGYPAVVVLDLDAILYYTQYTEGIGWTTADGITPGSELITLEGRVSSVAYDFQLDADGQPLIFWQEYSGSGTYSFNYRFTRLVNGSWKHADKVTPGFETVVSYTDNILGNFGADFEVVGNNFYFAGEASPINTIYAWKWDGNAWRNLDDSQLTTPSALASLTEFLGGRNPQITAGQTGQAYVGCYTTAPITTHIGLRSGNGWKHVDGLTAGIEALTYLSEANFIDFHINKDNNLMVYITSATNSTDRELYFSQWKNAWVQSDGVTPGWEAATNLINGSWLSSVFSVNLKKHPIAYDNNGYPIFLYSNWTGSAASPTYLTRFTGDDFKGANMVSNDQDTVFPISIYYPVLYFDQDTQNIFVLGGSAAGYLRFTKFNNNLFPTSNQDLVSQKVATAFSGQVIDKATLRSQDTKPAGTAINYYLSADGGAHWESVTPGIEHNFTYTGSDLRWKATLTNSNANSSPLIEYLYIDVSAQINGSTNDVIVTADVAPTLTFTLSSNNCSLGTFSPAKINTCSYNLLVTTNASSGYIAYLKSDGDLRNSANSLVNVSGGTINPGTEFYGISTTKDFQDVSRTNDANSDSSYTAIDCTFLNNNTLSANASALTTSYQSIANSILPIEDDQTTICHEVAISGQTPAGSYSQTVEITIIGNF